MNCSHCRKKLVIKKTGAGYPYCARCGATVEEMDKSKIIGYLGWGSPVYAPRKKQPKKSAKKRRKR